jgi:hypothetical protein
MAEREMVIVASNAPFRCKPAFTGRFAFFIATCRC